MDKLMIGVATRQNIVNVLPAIQLKATHFVFMLTPYAKSQAWVDGSKEVLKNRGIHVLEDCIIEEEGKTELGDIATSINNTVEKWEGNIIWNVSGGQKKQVLPMWQWFINRVKDSLCYMNHSTKKIEVSILQNGYVEVQSHLTGKIKSDLTFSEILNIYGKDINTVSELNETFPNWLKKDYFRKICFWLPTTSMDANINDKTLDLNTLNEHVRLQKTSWLTSFEEKIDKNLLNRIKRIHNPDTFQEEGRKLARDIASNYHSFVFGSNKRPSKLKISFSQNHSNELKLAEEIPVNQLTDSGFKVEGRLVKRNFFDNFEGAKGKFSFYYENVVNSYLKKVFEKMKVTGHIIDFCFNPTIVRKEVEGAIAEYEALVATCYGNLLAFDAKTFDLERKDRDARLFNLASIAGEYANYILVVPLHKMDIGKDYLPKELYKMPRKIMDSGIRNIKLYFYNHPDEEDEFEIKYDDGQTVKVRHLSNFVSDFDLS